MKLDRTLVPALVCCALAFACRSSESASTSSTTTIDAEAQAGVPASMKQYWFGLIRRGPNSGQGTDAERQELQRAHLANIGRLAKEGKLVLAGPFGGDGDLRGVFVYDVETEAEARALVDSDPAVAAGTLVVDLLPWWATSKLPEIVRE